MNTSTTIERSERIDRGVMAIDDGLRTAVPSTLEFLLRRMRLRSDFPAMSSAIAAINRMVGSDSGDANTLSEAILKDFALTNKILRLVNSVHYGQFSVTRISTISRAIVILGVDAIRNMTISLMLFDQIRDRAQAEALGAEFLRASLGALLAKELCPATLRGNAEEAYICALFHRLGRVLTHCYFAEEAEAIRRVISTELVDEEVAAARVLGLSYQDLGIAVARSWAFPESMIHSMRRMPPGRVPAILAPQDGLRTLSAFSCELVTLIETAPGAERAAALDALCRRYRDTLALSRRQIETAIEHAAKGLADLATIFNIELARTALGRQLQPAAALVEAPAVASFDEPAPEPEPGTDAESLLAVGIQDISNALLEDCSLSDLLRIVTETIYRAIGVRRVVLCLRDGRHDRMHARLVLGANPDATRQQFQFSMAGQGDLFNAILSHEVDVLISDAAEPKVRQRLPEWYVANFNAPTFIVLPLRIRQSPVGMIYADHDAPGRLAITPKALSLLRTLRNQAVLAIKQKV